MKNGKTDLQTSNSKDEEENDAPKVYFKGYLGNVFLKDTFRGKDSKASAMHISLWLTSSSHLLWRTFQPSKANSLTCLKSPPRGSENYSKDVHFLASCFQACNLLHYASTNYSSITYVWALLTTQSLVILSHCAGYSSAVPIWKTHFGYMQTILPTPSEKEQLSFPDSLVKKASLQNFPRKLFNISS